MAKLEDVRKVFASLHDEYKKMMGAHPSKLTQEKRTAVCVKMIDEALRDFNKMDTLLWAYDWLSNPDMADSHEQSVYGQHYLFNRLSADECAEMKIYAEVSKVAFDMDMVHEMKMPPFLSHLGQKFDIDNDQLCDFIFDEGHEAFSLRLTLCLAMGMLNKYIGVNGVCQDRLANEIQHYKYGMDKAKKEELKEHTNDLVNLIFHMHNHEEIGKMIGLRGWQLGNYDAIRSWFYEPFDPRIVKMTKELNKFILPIMKGEQMDIMPKNQEEFFKILHNKLDSLAEKYEVTLYEEDLTFNYIYSNNSHLFNIIIQPAD